MLTNDPVVTFAESCDQLARIQEQRVAETIASSYRHVKLGGWDRTFTDGSPKTRLPYTLFRVSPTVGSYQKDNIAVS